MFRIYQITANKFLNTVKEETHDSWVFSRKEEAEAKADHIRKVAKKSVSSKFEVREVNA